MLLFCYMPVISYQISALYRESVRVQDTDGKNEEYMFDSQKRPIFFSSHHIKTGSAAH
jgi:hypothetical protein